MSNIFALANNIHKSAIAIIRFSGSNILNDLINIFKINNKKISPRTAYLINIYDKINNYDLLDKILLIYFSAPNSYTGEEVVEFHLHASPYIVNRIFKILTRENYAIAKARRVYNACVYK